MQFSSTRRRTPLRLVFVVLGGMVCGLSPAHASVVTLTLGAGKVSTIFENQPNNSIGKGPVAFVGGDASGSPRRGLIDFNVAANIPAAAIITGVELTLYLAGTANGDGTPRAIELHRLTGNWAHGPTGLGVTDFSGIDQGFPAIPPSPTWNERRYRQNQPWITPGGDFSAAASATATVGQTLNAAYTWTSTPALVADVQAMLNAPSTNNGWMLLNSDEWLPDSYRIFYTQAWADTAQRPQLQVSYELPAVPLPSAAWLFGSGLIGLLNVRRWQAAGAREV
ncbi:DNRLRE domain-containing protein [Methylomonas sp. 2BW1-5-20]|uniref:DNRLRE domain-containing protein n=1 Tax=Methylomonas sp. 2BW1-5-20 TaxID=3376686 RepID=UPI00405081B6